MYIPQNRSERALIVNAALQSYIAHTHTLREILLPPLLGTRVCTALHFLLGCIQTSSAGSKHHRTDADCLRVQKTVTLAQRLPSLESLDREGR